MTTTTNPRWRRRDYALVLACAVLPIIAVVYGVTRKSMVELLLGS